MQSYPTLVPRPAPQIQPLELPLPSRRNVSKQRRYHHTTEEWEAQKPQILRLYINEKKKVEDLLKILSHQFHFKTCRRQLFNKFKEWGVVRNKRRRRITAEHMPHSEVPRSPSLNLIGGTSLARQSSSHVLSPPRFQSPTNYSNRPFDPNEQYFEFFQSLIDPPTTRTPQGSPSPDIMAWKDVSLRTTTPPPAPMLLLPEQLPWFKFQKRWPLPALDPVATYPFLYPETYPSLHLARLVYRSSSLLPTEGSEVYEILNRQMPELYPQQNLARSQALTRQLTDAHCSTSMMELLLFLASNNISLGNTSVNMDDVILDVTECLLRMKAPVCQLSTSSEPTAQALAGRIFASAVRRLRIGLLKRLSGLGFRIQNWTRRRIPVGGQMHFTILGTVLYSVLPIHFALRKPQLDLVEFLLEHGADINDSIYIDDHATYSTILVVVFQPSLYEETRLESAKFVLQHPKYIAIENHLLFALEYSEGRDDKIGRLFLDCLQKLNRSHKLMSPSWALLYAIRHSHEGLIDDIVPIWKPEAQPSEPHESQRHLIWNEIINSTPLLEAACHGNYMLCERLLSIEMSYHPTSRSIPLALLIAAHMGHVDILQLLISRGVQVDYFNEEDAPYLVGSGSLLLRGTALHCAIRGNYEQTVQFLLDQGAICDTSYLMDAVMHGSPCIIEKLLEFGLKLLPKTPHGKNTLVLAIKSRNSSCLNYLLDHIFTGYDAEALLAAVHSSSRQQNLGKDPLVKRLLSRRELHTDLNGQNAPIESLILAQAVFDGCQDFVLQLMKHGFVFSSDLSHYSGHHFHGHFMVSDRSVRNTLFNRCTVLGGCSLIGVAMLGCQYGMLLFLMTCGHQPCLADFDCAFVNDRSFTSRHAKAPERDSALMRLLQLPSFVNLTREKWPSYLPLAIYREMTSVVEFFLEQNIDVNVFSARICSGGVWIPSQTALQVASARGDITRMRTLIGRGARVNAPASRKSGATALQYAVIHGFIGAMKLLIEEGADINAPGSTLDGRTALEAAAEHGRIDMIQYLLLEGVETTGCGQFQYLRAIQFAKAECHYAAACLLEDHRVWSEEDHAIFGDIAVHVDEDLDYSNTSSESSDWGSNISSDTDEEV